MLKSILFQLLVILFHHFSRTCFFAHISLHLSTPHPLRGGVAGGGPPNPSLVGREGDTSEAECAYGVHSNCPKLPTPLRGGVAEGRGGVNAASFPAAGKVTDPTPTPPLEGRGVLWAPWREGSSCTWKTLKRGNKKTKRILVQKSWRFEQNFVSLQRKTEKGL